MSVYFEPGKRKSRKVARAFADGCGGIMAGAPAELQPCLAAFYGVKPETAHLFEAAEKSGRDWYYIDNGYFRAGEDGYFRVTRNRIQHSGRGAPRPEDHTRLRRMGVDIAPWRPAGRHIVVCLQTEWWYRRWGRSRESWLTGVTQTLADLTDRLIVVREKPHLVRQAGMSQPSLAEHLKDAWALVAFTSNAAVEAIIAGVPAFVDGPSAAAPMANDRLAAIEHPRRPEGREDWAAVLAANQWSLEEMKLGIAWKALTRDKRAAAEDEGR